jgi:hypothetical protein
MPWLEARAGASSPPAQPAHLVALALQHQLVALEGVGLDAQAAQRAEAADLLRREGHREAGALARLQVQAVGGAALQPEALGGRQLQARVHRQDALVPERQRQGGRAAAQQARELEQRAAGGVQAGGLLGGPGQVAAGCMCGAVAPGQRRQL